MLSKTAARLGAPLSVIGLGTWQLGADWGEVSEADAHAVLNASAENGVTFFDTADVYGDGRSEQVIGRWLAANPDSPVLVATKMGRRGSNTSDEYALKNFRAWTDRSRANLGVDTLDLVQLHCPPTAVYSTESVYDALDTLVAEGAIARYGVSVETVDEALTAIAHPNVVSVQIVFNAFRLKPLESVLPAAADAGVAIIARVPLASGLLTAKYSSETVFAENDHRNYNREGAAFDVGETFAGVDFEKGVSAAREFATEAELLGLAPSTAAIAWLAQLPEVTTVIPGARSVAQAVSNASAGEVAPLPAGFTDDIVERYNRYFRESVHARW